MTFKPRRRLVILVLLLLAPGCYILAPARDGVPIAAGAIAQLQAWFSACANHGTPVWGSFESTTRPGPQHGFIITYSAQCSVAGQPPLRATGHVVYEKIGLFWRATGGGGSVGDGVPRGPVDFSLSVSSGHNGVFSVIYGEVLVQQPLTIEGHFGDQTIVRETVAGGPFALVPDQPLVPCKLRVLDAHGGLMLERDLDSHSVGVTGLVGSCWP